MYELLRMNLIRKKQVIKYFYLYFIKKSLSNEIYKNQKFERNLE